MCLVRQSPQLETKEKRVRVRAIKRVKISGDNGGEAIRKSVCELDEGSARCEIARGLAWVYKNRA